MKKLPLSKSFQEINRAKQALIKLKTYPPLEIAEEFWCAGISHVERAWEKAGAEFRLASGFAGWNSKFVGLRRSDELLQYINQARNVEEHTIETSVSHNPANLQIARKHDGSPRVIRNKYIRGAVVHIESDGSGETIDYAAPHLELKPVVNRGQTFNPPANHLGKPIAGTEPIAVIAAAIEFYENYLQQVREQFA